MVTRTFEKGEVVFREGDPGVCMYTVDTGRVGIYAAYGTPEERLLAEAFPDNYFGEMGLFETAARSATAVALESDTCLSMITPENFAGFFAENPARVLAIMQQMSHNLRRRTDDYVAVCRDIKEFVEKEGTK